MLEPFEKINSKRLISVPYPQASSSSPHHLGVITDQKVNQQQ